MINHGLCLIAFSALIALCIWFTCFFALMKAIASSSISSPWYSMVSPFADAFIDVWPIVASGNIGYSKFSMYQFSKFMTSYCFMLSMFVWISLLSTLTFFIRSKFSLYPFLRSFISLNKWSSSSSMISSGWSSASPNSSLSWPFFSSALWSRLLLTLSISFLVRLTYSVKSLMT